MSIFKDGHNLQIRRKDKDKDKDHAIASDLEVVFNGNFQMLTSLFSNSDDISNEAFLSIKYLFVALKK